MVEIAPFTQLQVDHLKEYLRGNQRILEIGCGSGRLTFALAPLVRKIHAIDPNAESIHEANELNSGFEYKRKIKFKVAEGERTGYKKRFYHLFKKKFDIVVFSLSLHFLRNPLLGLEEAYSVLKKNGVLLILEPKKDSYFMGVWRLIDNSSFRKKWDMIHNVEKIIKSVNQKTWFSLREVKIIQTPIRGNLTVLADLLNNNIKSIFPNDQTIQPGALKKEIGEILSTHRVEPDGVYAIPHALKLFILQKV